MRLIELRDIPGSENIEEGADAAWFDFDKFSCLERHDWYDNSTVNLYFSGDTVCVVFENNEKANKFIDGVLSIVKENAQ